jgi:RNA polymerase sigma-70 factor (ECF subfamily)
VAASAEAIEELYRARYVAFRNALATVVGGWEAAHDVVQDAFAQALRERATFRGDGSLEGWVWRIAFRTALRARRNGTAQVPLEELIDPALVEAERDPELAAALRRLPPRKRLIVFLHYFADLSYADIATACGISEGTVAAALAQARTTLHDALRPREVKR